MVKTDQERLEEISRKIEGYRTQTRLVFEALTERVEAFKAADPPQKCIAQDEATEAVATMRRRPSDAKKAPLRPKERFRSSNRTMPQKEQSQQAAHIEKSHEDSLEQHNTGRNGPALRYSCKASQLGENMVSTIQKARLHLGSEVDEHGYLLLETEASSGPMSELLRTCAVPQDAPIQGFRIEKGIPGCINAYVNRSAVVDFATFSDLEHEPSTSHDPEKDFQLWISDPPTNVSYLICDPLKENHVNHLLDAGPLKRRPCIAGVNTPYWYVSLDADTPATIHIEDGNTGSANLLLAGADKHWLIVHRSSSSRFEDCVKTEFGSNNDVCSQFVRHHDLIPSPAWLRERAIKFEVVVQKPGDVMCTLPGRTYHAVRNTGKNFAVAINFEYEDAPDQPVEYAWCTKKNCGPDVPTLEDFMPIQDGSPSIEDIITISDNEQESTSPNHLPIRLEPPRQGMCATALATAFVEQCSTPEWLGYDSMKSLQVELDRFSPGQHLSDVLVRQLLQLISLPRQFTVIESLGLDVATPTVEQVGLLSGGETKGLVFPFHVNIEDQTNRTGRNHWALGIFDYGKRSFTTFGVSVGLCERWVECLEHILQETYQEPCKVTLDIQCVSQPSPFGSQPLTLVQLPPNPDGASCGLCCCLALEQYLGTYNEAIDDLRAHYLWRLLEHYRNSIHLSEILPQHQSLQISAALRSTQPRSMNELQAPDHDICEQCLDMSEISEGEVRLLKRAVLDNGCTTTFERRARLAQMIMQCSSSQFDACMNHEIGSAEGSLSTPRSITMVMEEITRSSEAFCIPTLYQRLLYMELDVMFRIQEQQEIKKMQEVRKQRKRMQAGGTILDSLPESGKSSYNRVLDRIIAQMAAQDESSVRTQRTRLRTWINIGQSLNAIVFTLGPGVLFALPATTVYPPNMALSFRRCRHASLDKALEPNEQVLQAHPLRIS
jgi:hypothetical protein